MPRGIKRGQKKISEAFDDCYIPEPNSGCWLWLRATNELGYGQVFVGSRKRVRAHRFSYERVNGPLMTGDNVLHKCDVPSCVNPDHLFVGTLKDNALDMAKKGRQHLQKLSVADVLAIRSDLRPLAKIAADYGIVFSNVSMIKRRKTWTHVP